MTFKVGDEWSNWIEDETSFYQSKGRTIVEYDEDGGYVRHKVKLVKLKPVIEVGGEYVDKLGNVRICIYVEGGVAWLKRKYDTDTAYTWKLTGESKTLGGAYDIDWSKGV